MAPPKRKRHITLRVLVAAAFIYVVYYVLSSPNVPQQHHAPAAVVRAVEASAPPQVGARVAVAVQAPPAEERQGEAALSLQGHTRCSRSHQSLCPGFAATTPLNTVH